MSQWLRDVLLNGAEQIVARFINRLSNYYYEILKIIEPDTSGWDSLIGQL